MPNLKSQIILAQIQNQIKPQFNHIQNSESPKVLLDKNTVHETSPNYNSKAATLAVCHMPVRDGAT